MKRFTFVLIAVVFLAVFVAACGGEGSNASESASPLPDEPGSDNLPNTELELVVYDDRGVLHAIPVIGSQEDLEAFRAYKLTQIEHILAETRSESADKPYYPVIITMNRPVSLAEMRQMLSQYNPTVAKFLTTNPLVKYLPKVELVKNEDRLLISTLKFVSTQGGGQMSYDTLTNDEEISRLEEQIAIKEKELNGVDGYQLFKGITSVYGGIHRDSILPIQQHPYVFLADIGPVEMYEQRPESVLWDDVYEEVEKYSK